jgi:spore germination cell wall hydrolase CwlJ-like protein
MIKTLSIYTPIIAIFLVIFFGCLQSYATVAPPPPARDFRVRLIEAVLLAEARSEGPKGVRMVAEVIRNRARQQHTLPIYVVQKPKQFSCLNDMTGQELIERMGTEQIPSNVRNMAQRCAYVLAFPESHGRAFNELNFDYAHGATHYHAIGPKPKWAGGRKPVASYLNHIFYKLN